jgi:mRNA interferase RelE/StbE
LKVFLSGKARTFLEDCENELRQRLEIAIAELINTPFPTGCKKLKGARSAYRLRVGGYRILYTIVSSDEILVFKIAPRESVYE